MSGKRYAVYPGWVRAKGKLSLQRLTCRQVAERFGVPASACVFLPDEREPAPDGLEVLRPELGR